MKKLSLSIFALSTALAASPASAAPLFFNFIGENISQDLSFSLDSNPVPEGGLPGQFAFFSVPITTIEGTSLNQLDFFATGGFNVGNVTSFKTFQGPILFSGMPTDPTFLTGSFALSGTGGTGILTIGSQLGAVPEPATWAFMIFGFAFTGSAMRFKRKPKIEFDYA